MLRSALRHAYGEVPMLTPTSGRCASTPAIGSGSKCIARSDTESIAEEE